MSEELERVILDPDIEDVKKNLIRLLKRIILPHPVPDVEELLKYVFFVSINDSEFIRTGCLNGQFGDELRKQCRERGLYAIPRLFGHFVLWDSVETQLKHFNDLSKEELIRLLDRYKFLSDQSITVVDTVKAESEQAEIIPSNFTDQGYLKSVPQSPSDWINSEEYENQIALAPLYSSRSGFKTFKELASLDRQLDELRRRLDDPGSVMLVMKGTTYSAKSVLGLFWLYLKTKIKNKLRFKKNKTS